MRESTVTIEFTVQEFDKSDNIIALRSWVENETVPLTHPAREILWKFAERFRVIVADGQDYLHVESQGN